MIIIIIIVVIILAITTLLSAVFITAGPKKSWDEHLSLSCSLFILLSPYFFLLLFVIMRDDYEYNNVFGFALWSFLWWIVESVEQINQQLEW